MKVITTVNGSDPALLCIAVNFHVGIKKQCKQIICGLLLTFLSEEKKSFQHGNQSHFLLSFAG